MGINDAPSGAQLARDLRKLPRDELEVVVEVLELTHQARLARHALSQRLLLAYAQMARAILAGEHPGPAVGRYDELCEVLVADPLTLASAEMVALAESVLLDPDEPA